MAASLTLVRWFIARGGACVLASHLAAAIHGCPPRGESLEVVEPLSSPSEAADELLRRADADAESGHLREARQRYDELLTRYPDDPLTALAHLGVGRIAIAEGRPHEALDPLERASATPDSSVRLRAQIYRGVALHLAGRPREALEQLEPVLGTSTNPEETRLMLDSVRAAATAEHRGVLAVQALELRIRAATEDEEPALVEALTSTVGTLTPEELEEAYGRLARDGSAWPRVAERALRDAHASGDGERVRTIASHLAAQGIVLRGELASMVTDADRLGRADPHAIGVIAPLTGPLRDVGQRALRGALLAAGVPAEGPVPPGSTQVLFRDDASTPVAAARAVEELVTVHRVVAIVGPLDPACADAAARRARELGVPLLSLSTAQVEGGPVLRAIPTLEEELAAIASDARASGGRRVVIVRPESRWGERAALALRSALGAELVLDVTSPATATSFGPLATRVAEAQPDTVIFAETATRIALIAPALAGVGLWGHAGVPASSRRGSPPRGVRYYVTSVGLDRSLATSSGRYLAGARFVGGLVPEPPPSPVVPAATAPAQAPAAEPPTSFVGRFRARFGSEPDVFSLAAHDAVVLVRAAVDAGRETRDGVVGWLAAGGTAPGTVRAPASFGEDRRPRSPLGFVELRDGAFRALP